MGDRGILHTSCIHLSARNVGSWSKGPDSWCLGWQDGAVSLGESRNEQKKIRARESSLEEETAPGTSLALSTDSLLLTDEGEEMAA